MNTPVSSPIAKLLKEKGFNLKVINFYDYERLSTPFDKQRQVDGLINYNPINWNSIKEHYTSAPTIADVWMWLYEKRGIWITINMMTLNGVIKFWCQYFKIQKLPQSKNNFFIELPREIEGNYNSLTEAYEAAIKYTLNNLI